MGCLNLHQRDRAPLRSRESRGSQAVDALILAWNFVRVLRTKYARKLYEAKDRDVRIISEYSDMMLALVGLAIVEIEVVGGRKG